VTPPFVILRGDLHAHRSFLVRICRWSRQFVFDGTFDQQGHLPLVGKEESLVTKVSPFSTPYLNLFNRGEIS
jgi:hypothetical protein